MSFRRHVNGLEFCYRTLVDRLGFATENIHVLNYDGSLRAFGDPESGSWGVWPGDGTAYRMRVSAEGNREAFQQALAKIGAKLTANDQLFINTTGHGGHHGEGWGPDLITYPHCRRFERHEFCAPLAELPPHRALVVLMAQCFSGGFNQAVIDASRAESTFIAAATSETRPSFMAPDDVNWDSFQRNWIAGLAGHDVDGTVIASSAREHISVADAFRYATTCPARSLYDSPEFAAWPSSAGDLTLRDDLTPVSAAA
jgi:hypothetical protein